MSVEFGSKIGLMNPDQKTFDYVREREKAPKDFERAVADWKTLVSDEDVVYDKVLTLDVSKLAPMVPWGTNPEMGVPVDQPFPEIKGPDAQRAYHYMDVHPGERAQDIDLGYILNWFLHQFKTFRFTPGGSFCQGEGPDGHCRTRFQACEAGSRSAGSG